MSLKPVNVGLLGLGTVGTGTLKVLVRNADEIARRAGRGIRVTHASARDLSKPRSLDLQGLKLCADPFDVVREPSVKVVVELIGGTSRARELVLEAIAHDKHVVTANKALLALHGTEIFEAAQKKGVVVAFEAAVAGGIPVIKAIREGLAGNRIEWLAGIINGTCNYILTQMQEAGRDFAQGGPGTRLCRGRSGLRHRRHRCRAQAHHSGLHCLRHPAGFRQAQCRRHPRRQRARHRLCARAGLPHQTPRHRLSP
jgi:homoserine dehydrogenase